ncbi:GIY-YIG nuclease family protein [Soonwooa sp.]|uniref:GIY-YIG nuclease family protein n=1 Tax=Soonwooa sp. TaxID=1938592 RepID=UPI0035B2E975
MYFIYILYSETANLYYVGYTSNIELRLQQHNEQNSFNTFTSKHRPWKLAALFSCGDQEKEAISIERFIKKQHSRKIIEMLVDPDFTLLGRLSQLVRVPKLRD